MTVRDRISKRLPTAQALLRDCRICPRQCGVDRTAGQKGWCGAGGDVEFFDEYVHFGEEPFAHAKVFRLHQRQYDLFLYYQEGRDDVMQDNDYYRNCFSVWVSVSCKF